MIVWHQAGIKPGDHHSVVRVTLQSLLGDHLGVMKPLFSFFSELERGTIEVFSISLSFEEPSGCVSSAPV